MLICQCNVCFFYPISEGKRCGICLLETKRLLQFDKLPFMLYVLYIASNISLHASCLSFSKFGTLPTVKKILYGWLYGKIIYRS